uniref:AB hydrolase-1 domain-containing protein n=1 Tax=Bionectria ochroleuca TaxID=29856 RepID=A0A8H7K9F6_BIOOC
MMFTDLLTKIQSFFLTENQRRAQSLRVEKYAKDIVIYIQEGNWESLHQQLVFPLRLFITKHVLEYGWKTLTSMAGPLQPIGTPEVHAGWPLSRISVPLQSERLSLALTLWMTWSGKLITLQVGPRLSHPWKAPSYASATSRSVSLTLGHGLRRVGATLTLPPTRDPGNEAFPCVILIGGSGPVDRDSTVGPSKPFKDLALGLAAYGISACRFDKRASTLLGKLTMSKKTATLTDEYLYHVIDAIRQVRRVPEINPKRIILLGHSLGTLVAARLASLDTSVAGCILMAAPSEPIYRCAIRQLSYLESSGSGDKSTAEASEEVPAESDMLKDLRQQADVADRPDLDLSTPTKQLPFGIGPAYWLEYRTFDVMETLKDIRNPVLILQGERDYQVTATEDYARLHEKFSTLPNFSFRQFKSLNHLFISGQGAPTPLEYFSPGNVEADVITEIQRWVHG